MLNLVAPLLPPDLLDATLEAETAETCMVLSATVTWLGDLDAAPEVDLIVTTGDEISWLAAPRRALQALGRLQAAPARLVMRARMVEAVVFRRLPISEVARGFGAARDTVRLWVQRYRVAGTVEALDDRPRTGRPPRLTYKDQGRVLSIACQKPQDFGRCEGRMTQEMIAEEATRQGTRLARSSVQRILAAAEVKPHREAYYLFTRKDDPDYLPRRDAICDVYVRTLPADEIVVCMDEKTGLQVLGLPPRTPHGGRLPPGYGSPGRLEQHYTRHGSRTFVGAVRPDDGKLVAWGLYASGTYKTAETIDLLRLIAEELEGYRVVHLVWDTGSTHRSAEMRAFLASAEARVFNVLYTPKHASWLNLAENFLSRFSRRFLHGKRWTGLEAFDADMGDCAVAYQLVAKPMRWRYNPRERAETNGRRRGSRNGQRFFRPATPAHPARA